MAIFDLSKDNLLRLSETQLEELIARLAEADVAAQGFSPANVSWSGSINASDEGVDIHVQVSAPKLDTGFLKRSDTILQAKRHSMPKSAIAHEMAVDGKLSQTISQQACKGGSYIIVSLADDCSPPMKKQRLKSMQDAVKHDPCKENIHLDFYDRSKLLQWLRQHQSVMLWVKGQIGQGYSGWQPYGAWSNPPRGVEDTLISAPGVSITLPTDKRKKLGIEEAISPMRHLIRSTNKAVRIAGLSGVGKTRIVQALFDETVGTEPLDRTVAVYVDTGADPEPSATVMLDRLISEGRRAVVILDNCPSDLHSVLAGRVCAATGEVSLITVEYDIRDDKPQTTEVIHIEANGPDVAEQLLIRRFPGIGQNNARRISEFADGNARVSLAIAERVAEGESLAQLSDAQLFNRLFEQRNHPDESLREHAEILALVYSFSITEPEDGQGELGVLGEISGYTNAQLYRSVKKLLDRHIAQKRSHWRAILPQAIANKLAASALQSIPVDTLKNTFERSGHARLLMSFAHRLGLMHQNSVAIDIVHGWLCEDGLLGQVFELNDTGSQILKYIAPVAPGKLLDRIEAALKDPALNIQEFRRDPRMRTVLDLLQSLAYEPQAFDRCARLMIRVAEHEDESNNYEATRNRVTRFFQPYFSGTHATLSQRLSIVNECCHSSVVERRPLGLKMLSTALSSPPWTGFGTTEFGARPRDFGYQPNYDQLVEWRSAFIDAAVQFGNSSDPDLEGPARVILANQFRGMWQQEAMRNTLAATARSLHMHKPWGEGWKAVRSLIQLDYSKGTGDEKSDPLPRCLSELEKDLRPKDLITKIMTYVLSKDSDLLALDLDFNWEDPNRYRDAEERLEAKAMQLGKDFAASKHEVSDLCPSLFDSNWIPFGVAFGRGLAQGCPDLDRVWQSLVCQLDKFPNINKNLVVFAGFIEAADGSDQAYARKLLDQCAEHPVLRRFIVRLHPRTNFTESDLDRCIALLDLPDVHAASYGQLLWQDEYSHLPPARILELAQRLLTKSGGDEAVLDGLSMKLHGKDEAADTLGPGLRLIGLKAAMQRLRGDYGDRGGMVDHYMENVLNAALRFEGNDAEKLEWIDVVFDVVKEHYGYIHDFSKAIGLTAKLMPEAFLERAFGGSEEEKQPISRFLRQDGLRQSAVVEMDVDFLIEWCRTKSDDNVWPLAAAGIELWSKDESDHSLSLSNAATKLLEAAPEPKPILEVYAERVVPTSWEGSLYNLMEKRAKAIGSLVHHQRKEVVEAALAVSEMLGKWIERQGEREQREDEMREQRFE